MVPASGGAPTGRLAVRIALVAAAYFVTGRAGLGLSYLGENVTLVWAPAGIALGALLVGGLRLGPGVWLGAFAVNWSVGSPLAVAAGIACGNTLEAVVGAFLLGRLGFQRDFATPRDLMAFLGIGVFGCTTIAASVGVVSLTLGGMAPGSELFPVWAVWWLGDAGGALLVAPPILTWSTWRPGELRRARLGEAAALVAGLLVTTLLVWEDRLGFAMRQYPVAFLVFPLLIWAALRFGARGAATATLAVAVLATAHTAGGSGPFVRPGITESLTLLLTFLGVAASASLLTAILSERDRAARALRRSEAKYRSLFDTSRDGIVFGRLDGRIENANPAYLDLFGFSLDELRALTYRDLLPAASAEADMARVARQVLARGYSDELELEQRRRDGTTFPALVRAWLVRDEEGRPERTMALVRDITSQRQAKEREAELGRILDESLHEIYAFDGETLRFRLVNRGARENLGYSAAELYQLTPLDLKPEFTAESFTRLLAPLRRGEREKLHFETVHRRKDGSRYPVEVHLQASAFGGSPVFLAVGVDMSERVAAEQKRRRLEAKMQQAQKLESLGVLAGGIAHDFNNLLAAMLGNTSLARQALGPAAPAAEWLEDAEQAAQRAAELCQQMLAYAGRTRVRTEPLDLSHLVAEMANLLEISISKSATLRYELGRELPAVEADATQLRQVLMNLIVNASDAIGNRVGEIHLRTGTLDADAISLRHALGGGELPAGRYAYMEVADTGAGMDAATRERIFDPFFTTKETGRGLGLAATLGIVRGHRGAIELKSAVGSGTRIRVLLPACALAARAQPARSTMLPEITGRGTVLVVDDEPGLRRLVRRTLEQAGFQVLCAADGREAVELFRHQPDGIDLVLLDLTMPGMDGQTTFDALRALSGEVRVLLSSGYDATVGGDTLARGLAGFLKKPYRAQELLETVRKALDAAPRRG